MTPVSAGELGDPLRIIILVKRNDRPVHRVIPDGCRLVQLVPVGLLRELVDDLLPAFGVTGGRAALDRFVAHLAPETDVGRLYPVLGLPELRADQRLAAVHEALFDVDPRT